MFVPLLTFAIEGGYLSIGTTEWRCIIVQPKWVYHTTITTNPQNRGKQTIPK